MLRKLNKWKCKRMEPLLWEYADGQLLPKKKERVEAHLNCCSACQARLQTAVRIGQGFDALRQASVPTTQANWADVQARLAASPVLPQAAAFRSKAIRYLVLMSAGTMAAITLLWFTLAPRESNQVSFVDKTSVERSAKWNMSQPILKTSPVNDAQNRNLNLAIEKSFLKVRTEDASPYLLRPVAPVVQLTGVAYNRVETASGAYRAGYSGRYIRRHRFTRRPRFLLARNEATRHRQHAPVNGAAAGMFTPEADVALSLETPNYVLTGVDGEAETGRPRAYVMDCLAIDARSQANEVSGQNGEERAW